MFLSRTWYFSVCPIATDGGMTKATSKSGEGSGAGECGIASANRET
jgi:hypothetical protein